MRAQGAPASQYLGLADYAENLVRGVESLPMTEAALPAEQLDQLLQAVAMTVRSVHAAPCARRLAHMSGQHPRAIANYTSTCRSAVARCICTCSVAAISS